MNIHEILKQDPEIWDLFSRKEEYNNPLRDRYDRFPYYASVNRDIFEPKASKYLIENGYSVEYPHQAPFAVCLTHDIDGVYQSVFFKGLSAIRHLIRRDTRGAFKSLSHLRSKKMPFCNFPEIMDLEEKYEAKSTFFFMAENPGECGYTYDIEDLEPEIVDIINRGWEVGLHGGHSTYLNPQEMKEKKGRLEKITHGMVTGYRNHYLRFRVPETWEYLSQAGFVYDATFGYADCAGFRNGMCHPFRPVNLLTGQEISLIEIPLIVMEYSVLGHMQMDTEIGWKIIRKLIDSVEKYHGVITILWHNTFMEGENLLLYERLLQYCHEKNAWMTSGHSLSSYMVDHGYH